MGEEYTPIKTNADRRQENIEAAKDMAVGFLKGVGRAIGDALDRLVPQGRDELSNALFNGHAYWPGEQPMHLPGNEGPAPGVEPTHQEIGPIPNDGREVKFDYEPVKLGRDHTGLYGVDPGAESPKPAKDDRGVNMGESPTPPRNHNSQYMSYTDRVDGNRNHGGNNQDKNNGRGR